MSGETDTIAQLEAVNNKLRERNTRLESRCGHLMNDRTRGIAAAEEKAEDCAEHGNEIRYLRRLAWWHWAASGQQEGARQSIVTALILLERDELAHRSEPVPVDLLCRWIRKAIDAQHKVKRKPEDWPPQGEYLAGSSDFPEAMKAEIAEALGLAQAESIQGALFGMKETP